MERDIRLLINKNINFGEVYRLAEEQAVIGIITAGLEHVVDMQISRDISLLFVGRTLQLEKRNRSMNIYLANSSN